MHTLTTLWERHQPRIIAALVTALLLLLAYWGGFPERVPVTTLALGLAFLIIVVLFFGFLIYWFYISPLPEKEQRRLTISTPSPLVRQIVGLGAALAAVFITLGLFWDELWHRLYGVGAVVDDFWWRPHLLLYAGMGINALFAIGGMFIIMQRGKGTLRHRFRAEPLIGLLTLAAGFQIITAPFDPLWHQIFGIDLTAWSLPHLLLGLGLISVMLASSSIQFSLVPRRSWRFLGGLCLNEILCILVLALAATILFQFGTTEWEDLSPAMDPGYLVFQRPEWLYPVVLITVSAFISFTALHLLRRVGAATLIYLLTLGLRLILMTTFNAAEAANMSYKANLLVLVPVLAVDLYYAYRLRAGHIDSPRTPLIGSFVLAVATFIYALPLINQWLFYPRLSPIVLIGVFGFGLLMAAVTALTASRLGAWLRALGETTPVEAQVPAAALQRLHWVGAGALIAALAFIAVFIATATPPIT